MINNDISKIIYVRIKTIAWTLFRAAFLFGLSFVLLYPLIYMLSMAFRMPSDMANPAVVWIPRNYTLQNIRDAIKFMEYDKALINTLRLGFASSFFQIISCALIGYGFARFSFKFKSLIFGLVLFTIVVPPQVLYVPTFLMYKDFDPLGVFKVFELLTGNNPSVNILDTALTLYLPAILGLGVRSGFFIYIYKQFFRGLPRELEDAAYIDGSGIYGTFIRIVIPNALPAFLTVILFSIVWYWNDYFFSSMYFSQTKTISTALAGLVDAFTTDTAYDYIRTDPYLITTRLQAGCLLAIAPILTVYVVLQKYFTESIERTGIVG